MTLTCTRVLALVTFTLFLMTVMANIPYVIPLHPHPQVVAGHSAQKSPLPPVDLSKTDISLSQLHQLENLLRRYANIMCLALAPMIMVVLI